MASMSEPSRLRWWTCTAVLVLGCRAGLPAAPPEHDAAAGDAAIPKWTAGPDPLHTSAFAGERLDADPHAHHHGHGKPAPAPKESP